MAWTNEGRRKYYQQHKERAAETYRQWADKHPGYAMDRYRRRVFGISTEDYLRMVEERGGRCDLCGEIPDKPLHIDHDHRTGKVRGLLCVSCNTGIGKLGDDVDGLYRALRYVQGFRP